MSICGCGQFATFSCVILIRERKQFLLGFGLNSTMTVVILV